MKKKYIINLIITLILFIGLFIGTSAQVIEVKVATELAEDSVLGEAMKYFKEIVEERSNGGINVVNYFGGVLGEERSVLEQLETGTIEMNVVGEGPWIWHAPEYDFGGIPFLYKDGQQVIEIFERLLEDKVRDLIIDRIGTRVVAISLRSPRNLVTVDKKILHPEDIKGLNMRLPTFESWVMIWEGLGAHPQTISGSEQFAALQMGLVEATENPIETLYSFHLTEPCKYIHLTEHIHGIRVWSISEKFYQNLSNEHKNLITECIQESAEWLTNREFALENKYLVIVQEEGLEVVVPDVDAIRERVKDIVASSPYFKDKWAPGVFEQYIYPLLVKK